ncbi:MAG TPA: hypothetical protein VIH56_06780 [Candidatus Acidoferrales bacterium]
MTFLLGVIGFYFVLALVVVSAMWFVIAHKGFEGLEQSNSFLVRIFKPKIISSSERRPEPVTTSALFVEEDRFVVATPIFATAVLTVQLLIPASAALPRPGRVITVTPPASESEQCTETSTELTWGRS